jgi:hypothetical protein
MTIMVLADHRRSRADPVRLKRQRPEQLDKGDIADSTGAQSAYFLRRSYIFGDPTSWSDPAKAACEVWRFV